MTPDSASLAPAPKSSTLAGNFRVDTDKNARDIPAHLAATVAEFKSLAARRPEFGLPLVSAPRGLFALAAPELAATPLAAAGAGPGYGRCNRLAPATGEDIAWILEILPPA